MNILLLGCTGRIGHALQHRLASLGDLMAMDRGDVDLADLGAVASAVRRARPDAIVNAAAYTAVDRAEREPDLAHRINADAPAVLAREAAALGAWLVHYSTDHVFGDDAVAARDETAPAHPLNAYGRSKLAGEHAIRAQAGPHLILRTGWIQSAHGSCFARSILEQARTSAPLRVVDDQVGAPTSADLVAEVTAQVLRRVIGSGPDRTGTYHLVAGGQTSWHGCARHVLARAIAAGLPLRAGLADVLPITSAGLTRAARRPLNSRLDTGKLRRAFGLDLPDWQEGVDRVVDAIIGATQEPAAR